MTERSAAQPGTPGVRTVVMGYHAMGCLGLDALVRHGYEVQAVLTHHDDPHEEIWWPSLAERAAIRRIPVHFAATRGDPEVAKVVEAHTPDFIFSFYFRFMIPSEVLAAAPRGALNLHGSLLPRYRGRAPVNWVLVNGETETGVSLHYMVAKPDAGALVDQERVEIALEDTAYTLFGKLDGAARRLLDRALPALRDGRAVARPMDLSTGSYFGGRRPEDGRIDWRWPAQRIYNLIRAVTRPYPGAFTEVDGARLFVWWGLALPGRKAAAPGTIVGIDPDGVTVVAGDGAVRLVTLQIDEQPELPAYTLARSRGWSVGTRLGE